MATPLIWGFLPLMAPAAPVGFAMPGGVAVALLLDGKPLAVIAHRLYTATQSFPMLATPSFMSAGSLMMSGRFGVHLVNIARLLVGQMKGGQGQVSIIGSVMFDGVSGSAVADALGDAPIPLQKQEGYPGGFAAAINSASSTISALIPPSIPLILYGLVANVAIVDLFVAGVVPGVLAGHGMFAAVWWEARRTNLPRSPLARGFRAFRGQSLTALPALRMPVFVIGALRLSVATPTEIGVMAVAYALLVSGAIHRDLSLRAIWAAAVESAPMTGAVMLITMASSTIQRVLTAEQAPQALVFMIGAFSQPWMMILALNLVMLVVGAFLDLPAAVLLRLLLVSIGQAIGLDPVQLGPMTAANLSIGLHTPPVGATLFISDAIAGARVGAVVRALPRSTSWPSSPCF